MTSEASPPEPQAVSPPPLADRMESATAGLRAYVARTGVQDVDDLTQETLQRAWKLRASFDESRPLLPWLRRIALRLAIDRAQQRAPLCLAPDEEPTSGEPEPGRRQETREELLRLLEPLGEPARTLIIEFHGHGTPISVLAERLDLPVGTVKSYLHRARKRIATRLAQEDRS